MEKKKSKFITIVTLIIVILILILALGILGQGGREKLPDDNSKPKQITFDKDEIIF